MEKKVVIKATEEEILELVNKHFGINEDSIVATEELGNEDWVVDVSPYEFDLTDFIDWDKKAIKKYCMREALHRMCDEGILEAGEYIIDCTW